MCLQVNNWVHWVSDSASMKVSVVFCVQFMVDAMLSVVVEVRGRRWRKQ